MRVERLDERSPRSSSGRRRGNRARSGGRSPRTGLLSSASGSAPRPVEVHVGGCYAARKRHRAITREQALATLAAFEHRRAGSLARSHNSASQTAARATAPYLGAAALAMLPLRTG
ncbi:DUF6233 domain-containing protein [Streptomyces sp. NPDC096354]|uniref:DUF6233 domain-containing protein n=1 Tax=Streptomyces sp. NPDC096354 TaxID=3366088 RepID=UPI00382366E3